jgi:hypothetical protein
VALGKLPRKAIYKYRVTYVHVQRADKAQGVADMTNNLRYDAFQAMAKKINSRANRHVAQDIIGSAYDNANATVYSEKSVTEREWDSIFTGSIGELLSTGEYNHHVVAFFTTRGITY